MDKGIRSYVPCLLMLILLLGVPLGNLIDDENKNDQQTTVSSGVSNYLEWGHRLTDSYTVNEQMSPITHVHSKLQTQLEYLLMGE